MSTVIAANKMESIFDGKETVSIYARADEDQVDDKKLLHIVNSTPLSFETTVERTLTTTTKLAMQINEVFKPLFTDWHGCEVCPDQNHPGVLMVKFTFKAGSGGDDKKRAFLPISKAREKSSNVVLDRIMAINQMNSSMSQMGMTGYGAEMIYDVMSNNLRKDVNPNNPESMRRFVGEVCENVGYSGVQNIYCTVIGIDIYKILGDVFGTKEDNTPGNVYIYNARAIRPVDSSMMMNPQVLMAQKPNANYIVELERMTRKKYDSAMISMGRYPMPGTISAITGTISAITGTISEIR